MDPADVLSLSLAIRLAVNAATASAAYQAYKPPSTLSVVAGVVVGVVGAGVNAVAGDAISAAFSALPESVAILGSEFALSDEAQEKGMNMPSSRRTTTASKMLFGDCPPLFL